MWAFGEFALSQPFSCSLSSSFFLLLQHANPFRRGKKNAPFLFFNRQTARFEGQIIYAASAAATG
jgi:hypothetical protein